ncbi:MAG: N-formylglutamate amidohydrolase [Pseudomonadota bacterium]
MAEHRRNGEASKGVEVVRASGQHEIVLVCEHASAFIPDEFDGLGVSHEVRLSHLGWDPGAGETAAALSTALDAVLVRGTVSRLIYDCNRPPESPDAIRSAGGDCAIPGNTELSPIQRAERIKGYYRPFAQTLAATLSGHHGEPVLVTIHSFTPVFDGQQRDVEIGIVHDEDARLAEAVLAVASGYDIRRNEPYGPEHGVTHTLREHGLANGLLNVMIEIRNDLVATPEQCRGMADQLKGWLETALSTLQTAPPREVRA